MLIYLKILKQKLKVLKISGKQLALVPGKQVAITLSDNQNK